MSLIKGRQCSESAFEYLNIELVHSYARQSQIPSAAAIEAIGYRVGRQLIEKYMFNRPQLKDSLDIIRFICKEFWGDLFKKQVDNLRTNHRGTFVLSDRNFRWLSKISGGQGPGGAAQPPPLEVARDFLHLPCALLRGALTQLGMDCNVTADCANFPAADFTISPRQT